MTVCRPCSHTRYQWLTLAVLERDVTAETVNKAMAEAAETPVVRILNYSEEPLVSVD